MCYVSASTKHHTDDTSDRLHDINSVPCTGPGHPTSL